MSSLPLVALLIATLSLSGPVPDDQRWWWPLDPRPAVVRPFEAPPNPYAAGHRGIDLDAPAGAVVRVVDDGVVAFAGRVAGVEIVSVDHGSVRSTYQPVAADVVAGTRVAAGDVLGRLLLAGGHCLPRACLHLGRRHGTAYADPVELLDRAAAVRLVTPYGPPPAPPQTIEPVGPDGFVVPVDAPISSPFGMRIHPITGELRLHDGTDLAAACGTPVGSAAAGRVVAVTYVPAYGNRVVVEHGGGLVTSYNHLAAASVPTGAVVGAGSVVGTVGSTGLSTGCHLHWMALEHGRPIDPMLML
ncbi:MULTISPECIES: M23 family metallopeptidase [Mumia]|uniref:M23 family metallopeptidase n=1 Tax=Mumia xiangluensis TaxID=1678900 RepID=A0ABW1QSC8_9ACTN|nr:MULTISPECIES: M23 family metallopeptidase [Mumia]